MAKTIIIGGSHAGVTAATTIKKFDETAEVLLIEKSDNLAFIPSTLNFLFQKDIPENELELGNLATHEQLASLGIDVLLNTEITEIDAKNKTVSSMLAKNMTYDHLILAMGSAGFTLHEPYLSPSIFNNLILYKTKAQTVASYEKLKTAKNVVIIGSGLVGMELVNSLAADKTRHITILDRAKTALHRYFDDDVLRPLAQVLPTNVVLKFEENSYTFERTGQTISAVCLTDGSIIQTDAVVLALNPEPNSQLVDGLLALDTDKTIKVNRFMQTSDAAIYAVGDLVKIPLLNNQKNYYLPLIANARKESYVAAYNITHKQKIPHPISLRTVATSLFHVYLASCGITEQEGNADNWNVATLQKTYYDLAPFGEHADKVFHIKLIYSKKIHQILGVQLITTDRTMLELINQFSMLVNEQKTVEDLLTLDNYFAPKLSPLVTLFIDLITEISN
jgi:NADPH-dependent 2,4-dienoyl-CoA reductase/sulfur reductase-like enzyme